MLVLTQENNFRISLRSCFLMYLKTFFSHFSGKGAKRKRKVSECLHDVFLSIKNLALVTFFHYTTEEISQWKLNVT